MEHACNAYCTEAEHCELVLSSKATGDLEATRRSIDNAYAVNYGRRVNRIEPAPEAPGLDAFQPNDLHQLTPATMTDQARWLVWWA